MGIQQKRCILCCIFFYKRLPRNTKGKNKKR
nr:MAG TPA: hypothetical protein [Caudoviricetes sp.]